MRSRTCRRTSDRRGAALMTVMLLVLLLMIAIIGAFTRTTTERRIALDETSLVDAFAIAQSGIDQYLIAKTAIPSTLPDSATYTVTGGRAVVTLRSFRTTSTDTLLLITSRGEATGSRYNAGTSIATRTVAQFIRFGGGSIDIPGGFTALAGFNKNGSSGEASGIDQCPGSTNPAIAGVAVPTGGYSQSGNSSTNWINGNPDNAPLYIGTPGIAGTAKDVVDIDWAGIVARTSITPDYYQKTTSPTSGAWPTNAQINGTNWPTVFVEGNSSMPSGGQGILIVTGDLTMSGSDDWNGLVLVGGSYTSNGNTTVSGGLISGLNVKLGIAVSASSLGNGTKKILYNSCDLAKALAKYGGWSRMGNAWTDNWPSY
ncbi:MAG: hypothetical protein V4503_05805 [Gemmatimonadota bacterium]